MIDVHVRPEPAARTAYANVSPTLLGALDGTVLEIGPGSGANLGYYRTSVRWIGVEPDASQHERLRQRALQLGLHASILKGVAESLDLPDESVDAVVGTLVLCSVDDQARALAEVRRVLKPSGRYVFVEHVAAPAGTWTRHLQAVWTLFSRRIEGCHANRDTGRAIERAGFAAVEYERFERPVAFGFTVPFIAGTAYKSRARHVAVAPTVDSHDDFCKSLAMPIAPRSNDNC